MEAFGLLVMGLTNIACFLIGARVGQQTARGEDVRLPAANPMDAAREHQAKKEARAEKNRIEMILGNIDNYDGTGNGQKDIPRR